MTKVLCGSMAALALMLAPAVAADLSVAPIYKAPPAPPTNWTGSYIGLSGGGVWGNAKVYNGTTGADETPWFNLQRRPRRCYGWVRSSRAAIGCSASRAIPRSPARRAAHSNSPRMSASTTRSRSAGSRPIAAASASRRITGCSTPLPVAHWRACSKHHGTAGVQISETQWHWGWTVGAGVEVKLNQDWSAKVEYLYVGLQDKSYFNPSPSPGVPERPAGAGRRSHRARRRELQAALDAAGRLLQALIAGSYLRKMSCGLPVRPGSQRKIRPHRHVV